MKPSKLKTGQRRKHSNEVRRRSRKTRPWSQTAAAVQTCKAKDMSFPPEPLLRLVSNVLLWGGGWGLNWEAKTRLRGHS